MNKLTTKLKLINRTTKSPRINENNTDRYFYRILINFELNKFLSKFNDRSTWFDNIRNSKINIGRGTKSNRDAWNNLQPSGLLSSKIDDGKIKFEMEVITKIKIHHLDFLCRVNRQLKPTLISIQEMCSEEFNSVIYPTSNFFKK